MDISSQTESGKGFSIEPLFRSLLIK
jgi:hypothetical protein